MLHLEVLTTPALDYPSAHRLAIDRLLDRPPPSERARCFRAAQLKMALVFGSLGLATPDRIEALIARGLEFEAAHQLGLGEELETIQSEIKTTHARLPIGSASRSSYRSCDDCDATYCPNSARRKRSAA